MYDTWTAWRRRYSSAMHVIRRVRGPFREDRRLTSTGAELLSDHHHHYGLVAAVALIASISVLRWPS